MEICPHHVGWDGSVVGTAQDVSDEHLVATFADPQIENLQKREQTRCKWLYRSVSGACLWELTEPQSMRKAPSLLSLSADRCSR